MLLVLPVIRKPVGMT